MEPISYVISPTGFATKAVDIMPYGKVIVRNGVRIGVPDNNGVAIKELETLFFKIGNDATVCDDYEFFRDVLAYGKALLGETSLAVFATLQHNSGGSSRNYEYVVDHIVYSILAKREINQLTRAAILDDYQPQSNNGGLNSINGRIVDRDRIKATMMRTEYGRQAWKQWFITGDERRKANRDILTRCKVIPPADGYPTVIDWVFGRDNTVLFDLCTALYIMFGRSVSRETTVREFYTGSRNNG